MIFSKNRLVLVFITLALAALVWKLAQQTSVAEVPMLSDRALEPSVVSSSAESKPEVPSEKLSAPVLRQMQILDEIFASKNDNDLRMDTDLKVLSSEAKSALQKKYFILPDIQRNEKGTIVFLIGRNLNEATDYEFLKQVVSEVPCLGLNDCQKPMAADGLSGHGDNGVGLVLDYPQLTALKAIEKHPATTEAFKNLQNEVIQSAKNSKSSKISEAAQSLDRILR